MKDAEDNWLYKLLVPDYDELSLFLMSATFLLLFASNPVMRSDLFNYLFKTVDYRVATIFLIIPAGLALSIYHIFTERFKTSAEKWILFLYAILINASTGIYAGLHLWRTSKGWLLMFPVLNILAGCTLIILFWFMQIDEEQVVDDNVTPAKAGISVIAIFVIFYICQLKGDLHWAITFSICVAYATNFNIVMAMPAGLKEPSEKQFKQEFDAAYGLAKVHERLDEEKKKRFEKNVMVPKKVERKADPDNIYQKFRNTCNLAIADGNLSHDEKKALTKLAKELNIDEIIAINIFEEQNELYLRTKKK